MLTELIANLKARLLGSRAHPLTHSWLAARWLERNALLDPDERTQELLTEINSFNASPRLNSATLSAFLLFDAGASHCIRELIETYLGGNRAANKAVLRKLDDAARWFG